MAWLVGCTTNFVEVREDQAERAAEILKQSIIDGFAETFPGAPLNGLVEPRFGSNWGEAKEGETRTASERDAGTRLGPRLCRARQGSAM